MDVPADIRLSDTVPAAPMPAELMPAEPIPAEPLPATIKPCSRDLATALVNVQHWVRGNLPVEQSALAYELILLVLERTLNGSPLTLKELFHSLPYSETGIRKQLVRFVKGGTMRIEVSRRDGRVRHVVAEPGLIDLFDGLTAVLQQNLAPVLR